MDIKKLVIATVLIIIILLGAIFCIKKCKPSISIITEDDPVQQTIDSLMEKKDSLLDEIQDINQNLIEVNEEFISNRDSILSQSIEADYKYFTEYLNRHFNNNNSDTIKGN